MKLLIAFLLFTAPLIAQTEAITEDGKKVILRDDFTWTYAKKDSLVSMDCADLIKIESDKVTGKTTRYFSLVVSQDQKNGFALNVIEFQKSNTLLLITAVGAGSCIDDDDKANILFSDGSRMEVKNMGEFNCKGQFTLRLGPAFVTKKQAKELSEKAISTLRVWTSDGYVEEDFTAEEGEQLRAALKCLLD